MIYLDHNSTTPIRPEAYEAMLPYFKDHYGNPSSIHQIGQRARKAVEDARIQMAEFVGAEDPNEIIFTSGGTESNNMAIKGALEMSKSGNRIITSAVEHSSVRMVIRHLDEQGKAENVVVPVTKDGFVQVSDVADALTPNTALVTVMAANNELGTFQPIEELAKLAHSKNVPFFSDAVQIAGKIPMNVKQWGVDFLSLSGHKFGAPKGVGILYVRKGTRLEALLSGGRQEKNRRAGTENVPGIVAMGVAAEVSRKNLSHEVAEMNRLRNLFESILLKELPLISINGNRDKRTCNTTNICFEYTENSALLTALDINGLSSSSGSACHAGSAEPSHVLLAIGLPQEKAHASLRFSLGHDTTEAEIHAAAKIIVDNVKRQRQNHPLWKEAI